MSRRSEYYLGGREKYYPVGSDCVLYLAFWDGTAVDHSIYGNNGTVVGGTWVENGIYLDGTDDRVWLESAASLSMGTGDFTILFWAKGPSAGDYIILGASGTGLWPYALSTYTAVGQSVIYDPSWGGYYLRATAGIGDGTNWTQAGYVIDRDVGGYNEINGVFGAAGGTTTASSITSGRIGIGDYPPPQNYGGWDGTIGEMLFFNVAKTEAQCLEYYNYTKSRYGL